MMKKTGKYKKAINKTQINDLINYKLQRKYDKLN